MTMEVRRECRFSNESVRGGLGEPLSGLSTGVSAA